MRYRLKLLFVAATAPLMTILGVAAPVQAAEPEGFEVQWRVAWATAVQQPKAPFGSETNWSMAGLEDHTLRQVVRPSIGGDEIRLRISNRYGTTPLQVTGATVADAGRGAAVEPGSTRLVRFGGRPTAVIPPGADLRSDPVTFSALPLRSIAISMYLRGRTGPSTYHDGAHATTYRADGDRRFDVRGHTYDETSRSWYYLSGLEVTGDGQHTGAVAAFGDSLTDGFGTGPDLDNRYPDELAELLVGTGSPRPIANLGINGNKLLVDSRCFGENGVARFRDQVLGLSDLEVAVVSIGLNDIGTAGSDFRICGDNPTVSVHDILDGYREIVRMAHQHGVRVVVATLTPFTGHAYYSRRNERIRDEVNAWVRTRCTCDAVVDFEAALADPTDPDVLHPGFDSGDHLHPNDAGRRRMAEAVLPVLSRLSAHASFPRQP